MCEFIRLAGVFVSSLLFLTAAPFAGAIEPEKKAPVPTGDMKLEDPTTFKAYIVELQDKLCTAHRRENPAVRAEAVVAASKELDGLVGRTIAFESSTFLAEKPFAAVANGLVLNRGAGENRKSIEVGVFRNIGGDRVSRTSIEAGYSLMSLDAFKTLTGKETMTCWGVIVKCSASVRGESIAITVEGVITKDPFGKPIKRANEVTTNGRYWRGKLTYADGTIERADFAFKGDSELRWQSDGNDKHVYEAEGKGGDKYIVGTYRQKGDKVTVSLKTKTNNQVAKESEFRAEFEGAIRNGFLIEGTFKKSRARVPEVFDRFSPNPLLDIKNTKVEQDTKGTFQIINSQGD